MYTVDPVLVAQIITVAILLFAEAIGSQMIKEYSSSTNPF